MKKAILSTIVITALVVGCSDSRNSMTAKDATAANQFGDLPPAVQTTVKREVPNGIVDRVSTETKNGRLVYKIKFQDEGLNPSIWVTADGNILKSDINRDKALGATGRSLIWMVLRRALILMSIGVAIGAAGALALTRFMSGLLYEVQPTDAFTFFGAAVSLTALAVVASLVPA